MGKNTSIRIAVSIGFFLLLGVPVVHADTLGDQKTFSIDATYDALGRTQINATLRFVSTKAYFYVTDDQWNALDATGRSTITGLMNSLGNEFDTRIYPIETVFFGSEANPGVDGDSRITILFANLKQGVGGYFDSSHGYTKSQISNSNEREMLYLNTGQFREASRLYSFVAHEFQHLISHNQKELVRQISDDIWLNELRSEYAVTLLGYNTPLEGSNLERRIESFLNTPSDSLTEWKNTLIDYGHIAVFAEYIAQHFSSRVIADTLTTSSIGIISVNEALGRNGFSKSFDDLFREWMLDIFQNLRVPPTRTVTNFQDETVFNETINIKDWEQRWYDLQSFAPGIRSALRVQFSAPSAVRVAYQVFHSDGRVETIVSDGADIRITNLGTDVTRVVLMPYRNQKVSNFSANEIAVPVTLTVRRVDPAEFVVTPEQFGLHEGDFIRAEGDYNIYIINQFGFKRLVLSPEICLQYGHLGARGCFSAVRLVTPEVRDAFKTSSFYSNGETNDRVVYQLIETGEDSAYLQRSDHVLDNAVFFINNREQRTYTP